MLNPKAFGLASGITWGIGLALLALFALFAESYGSSAISLLSTVYLGYRPTVPGAIAGAAWGFVDGFVCGYVFAWIYNYFAAPRA